MEQFSNSGTAVLNNGGTLTSGATSVVVTSEVNIPSTGTFRVLIESEIIKVTAVSSHTWTIVRGDGGTSAASHADGLTAYVIVTKQAVDALVSIQAAGSEVSNRRVLNIIGAKVADNSGNACCDITITPVRTTSNSGTIDMSVSSWVTRTLDGTNASTTLSNVANDQEFTLELVQDSTGGRSWTPFSGITWITPGSIAPTIATGISCTTLLQFKQIASNTYIGWHLATQADYAQTVLATSGLVSYWKLDESGGTSAADSKGSNTGTYTGGFTLSQPCLVPLKSAVAFNGSTGYVTVATASNLVATTGLSVECWYKPSTLGAANSNLRLVTKTDYELIVGTSTGANSVAWQCKISGSFQLLTPPAFVFAGEWAHLVGTFDGTTMSLYINGFLAASATHSGTLSASATALNIARLPDNSHYTDASFAHVAMYNTALSAATILNHYNTGAKTPPF